jgi:hypothetical protein
MHAIAWTEQATRVQMMRANKTKSEEDSGRRANSRHGKWDHKIETMASEHEDVVQPIGM